LEIFVKKIPIFLIASLWIFAGAAAWAAPSVLEQLQNEQVATIKKGRNFVVSIAVTQIGDGDGNLLKGKEAGNSTGSGYLATKDGKIVTNKHVADPAELIRKGKKAGLIYTYKVTLSNQKTYDAELVGLAGEGLDLAQLRIKIPPADLLTGTLSTTELEGGEFVYAIGSPFGLQDSVSMGIVSNPSRNLESASKIHRFIQTDAAINPGNSGGPLINIKGEVVGINTMIYTKSEGNIGLGFAIPAKVVRDFLSGIQAPSKQSGWIGITVDGIDPQTRAMFGIAANVDGLRVMTIDPRSPATGKLVPGDIIISLDDEALTKPEDWKRLIITKGEGTRVKIKISRGGKQSDVALALGKERK
jgi:serine protease Do